MSIHESTPSPGGRRGGDSDRKAILSRALGGMAVGVGLCVLILALAGVPPLDRVLAQEAAAPAAKTISGAEGTYWLPLNASEHGGEVDFLFNFINVIVGITFVGVEVLLIWFAWKYRHRPGRKAVYTHGNHKLELAWTITPAVILLIIVVLSSSTWAKVRYGNGPDPATSTVIEVTGQQFLWNFKYPGSGERFGKVDFAPQGQFHVPVNKPVSILLRSKDVLHSFAIPNMRVKLDAVPGMTGRMWFTPTIPGTYEVVCMELCGAEHWKMKAILTVDDAAGYEAWLKREAEFAADRPK